MRQKGTGPAGLFRVLLVLLGTTLPARDRIASIEFFGYKGIDVDALRNSLPFHGGVGLSSDMEIQARAAVKRVTGGGITDFQKVCCTDDGDSVVFIGLAESSSRIFRLNGQPHSATMASAELAALYQRMDEAEGRASRREVLDRAT